jgi:hypothetical protein
VPAVPDPAIARPKSIFAIVPPIAGVSAPKNGRTGFRGASWFSIGSTLRS